MPHISEDRVRETSTSTGTGAFNLAGAVSGFRTFASVMATSDTCYYAIVGGAEWEVGLGTYSGVNTLTRTTVLRSSNANAAVTFSAGTKDVWITAPSVDLPIFQPDNGMNMPEIAAATVPTTPPSGQAKMFNRLISNRPMFGQMDDGAYATFMQPWLARNRIGLYNPAGNSSGLPGVFGMVAPTTVGTATARNIATTNRGTRMRRLGMVSAGTAGSLASFYYNAAVQFGCGSGSDDGSGFHFVTSWVPSNAAAVSGERRFVGLANSIAAPTNVNPDTLTNSIGVGQLAADATQLYLCYGGSAAQTAIAMGATNFPGGTLSTTAFELSIFAPWWAANTYYVQVTNLNNGAVFTQTLTGAATVVPQSGTLLNWRNWACNNATALAVGVDQGIVYTETPN